MISQSKPLSKDKEIIKDLALKVASMIEEAKQYNIILEPCTVKIARYPGDISINCSFRVFSHKSDRPPIETAIRDNINSLLDVLNNSGYYFDTQLPIGQTSATVSIIVGEETLDIGTIDNVKYEPLDDTKYFKPVVEGLAGCLITQIFNTNKKDKDEKEHFKVVHREEA